MGKGEGVGGWTGCARVCAGILAAGGMCALWGVWWGVVTLGEKDDRPAAGGENAGGMCECAGECRVE